MGEAEAVAIIGLIGVGVGGLITGGFNLVKARSDQTRLVRENVTKFRHETRSYLQLVESAKAVPLESRKSHPAYGSVGSRFRAAREAGFHLIGSCPDMRVVGHAESGLDLIADYAAGHHDLFKEETSTSWPDRNDLDRNMGILHYMVSPWAIEGRVRFRGVKRAGTLAGK